MKPVHIILSSALCAALAAGAVLVVPIVLEHFSKFTSEGKIAILNLNEVVEANEAALAAADLKDEELMLEAKRFALSLQTEIKALQKDCGCTLLVSSAVIAPHTLPDYTDELLARLNLSRAQKQKDLRRISERVRGAS